MENRLKIISGSILKTVACITMLIDHIGAAGLIADNNVYWIFRTIGRTAFPI
ncbi:MAG: conjugal transfer protein TraX, partial [Oscillospiraceae bacterium]|nr:conjugal transfer protein TraX [Oscillospiraceae bacterium]